MEVARGIYAYVSPTGDSGLTNAGLIVGERAATVVDTLLAPSLTRAFADAVRKATDLPVLRVVNTHHHHDHTGGNWAFPDAERYASPAARDLLIRKGKPMAVYRALLPRFAPEFETVEILPPTVTVDGPWAIHDGRREIRILPAAPAHTFGDVMVYLPAERVLFAADVAFHYVTPLVSEGSVAGWLRACEAVLALDVDVIVPGHGPIGTRRDFELMRDYWLLLRDEGGRLLDRGLGPAEAARALDLGPYREWVAWPRTLWNLARWQAERRGPVPDLVSDDVALSMHTAMVAWQEER
jgi:glyoxylase-like metal-dependent hydrolase (beta-lactamase superfamily II)